MRTVRFDGKDVVLNKIVWLESYDTEVVKRGSEVKEPRYRIYMVFNAMQDDYLHEEYTDKQERDKRYQEILNIIQGVNVHAFF